MIKEKKIEGKLDLKGLKPLLEEEYEFLDISEAEMGVESEKWEVCLGWSHSGPVYGNSGWRDVEAGKAAGCKESICIEANEPKALYQTIDKMLSK